MTRRKGPPALILLAALADALPALVHRNVQPAAPRSCGHACDRQAPGTATSHRSSAHRRDAYVLPEERHFSPRVEGTSGRSALPLSPRRSRVIRGLLRTTVC